MTTEHTEHIHQVIAQRLGIEEAPDREEIVARVMETLSRQILVDLLPHLSEEQQYVLRDMLEDEQVEDEEIDTFLRTAMTEHKEVVKKSVEEFFSSLSSVVTNT